MKKTVVEYITNTLEDIPKQSLQTNKKAFTCFFLRTGNNREAGDTFCIQVCFLFC